MSTSLSGRVVATIVALALTGVPALAARPEESGHRCQCKVHARERGCECAGCHRGRRNEPRRAAAQAPPCHRAKGEDAGQARPRELAGRCMTGCCDDPGRHAAFAPPDAYALPLALAPAGALPLAGDVERPSGRDRDAPSLPDTPPPRGARPLPPRA